MHPLAISNNVIIIARPNEILGLNQIIRDVTANSARRGLENVLGVPHHYQSVNDNEIENENDGFNMGTLVNNNNRPNNPEGLMSGGNEWDRGHGQYMKSNLIKNLPMRDVYVFKTEVEAMLYYLYDKLSLLSNFQYFMVYKGWRYVNFMYYVFVKFSMPKKLSLNYLIYFKHVEKIQNMDAALAYLKEKGQPYYIPSETVNGKKINGDYPMIEMVRRWEIENKNKNSIYKVKNMASSLRHKRHRNSQTDNRERKYYYNENTSTRAASPIKAYSENSSMVIFNGDGEEINNDGTSQKYKGKCSKSKKLLLLKNKESSRNRDRERKDGSEEEDANEDMEKKDGQQKEYRELISLGEDRKMENSVEKVNITRIDSKTLEKKNFYI